jgi:hypothetical protein
MWHILVVIGYFALALLIPIVWAGTTIWRKSRRLRSVTCPRDGSIAMVGLDRWHAMRMHAIGDPETRIRQCSRWPHGAPCAQDCEAQIGSRL